MVVRKKMYAPRSEEPTEKEKKERIDRLAVAAAARKEDAPRAMREYRAAEEASRQRTARLRAERLARETGGLLPVTKSDDVRVAKRRST